MRWLYLLIFAILIYPSKNLVVDSISGATRYFLTGCSIIDKNANLIKQLPGYHCAILANGDFISSTPIDSMKYYRANGEVVWTDENASGHKLILSNNKKSFLTITSELNFIEGKKIRSDVFAVRNLDNKILKSWSTFKNLDKLRQLQLRFFSTSQFLTWPPNWLLKNTIYDGEITHANSIQEIDKTSEVPGSKIWKSGNYLVYLFGSIATLLVLDNDMKEILWFLDLKDMKLNQIHDVQVIPGARLLFFANNIAEDPEQRKSAIEMLDVFTLKSVWSYGYEESDIDFFSAMQGGAQLLDNGNVLFNTSDFDNFSFYEVTPDKKIVLSFFGKRKKFNFGAEVKVDPNLPSFLKNNRL